MCNATSYLYVKVTIPCKSRVHYIIILSFFFIVKIQVLVLVDLPSLAVFNLYSLNAGIGIQGILKIS